MVGTEALCTLDDRKNMAEHDRELPPTAQHDGHLEAEMEETHRD